MDLTKLETKTGAEKGAEMHLRHPALGHLLYSGPAADELGRLKPDVKKTDIPEGTVAVCVQIRGTESESVQEQARAFSQGKLTDESDVDDAALKFGASLIIGFKGLTRDGEPLEATEENKVAFLQQSYGLAQQVIKFAEDRANFFDQTRKG